MMRLIYADHALSDLEAIMDYVGQDNPPAAVRFGEGLLHTADLLEQNPEIGVVCNDLAQGLRVFTYRGYGLYYRIDKTKQAVILERVLHPALDVNRSNDWLPLVGSHWAWQNSIAATKYRDSSCHSPRN